MFKKYMHVERFGNDAVQGIELGDCYVFPKLDGTNGQLWWDAEKGLQAGSRNRHLDIHEDNAGFLNWALEQQCFKDFFWWHRDFRLYGEWLVPHSIKTYEDNAWRRFYVFDVERISNGKLLPYAEYAHYLKSFGIDYVPPISIVHSATYDQLLKDMQENTFLIKDGHGAGEGIVIKNYDYTNRFGHQIWAKIVTNAFKEKHTKETGPTEKHFKKMVETEVVETCVTQHLVNKVYAKIVNESQGWNSKYIPRLLQTVWYDLIQEELWDMIKQLKNPTINFKTLNTLTILKIKELRPELF